MINTRIVINAQFPSFEIDIDGVFTFAVTANVNNYSYFYISNGEYIDCGAGRFWQLVGELVESNDFAKIVNHLHDFVFKYGVEK